MQNQVVRADASLCAWSKINHRPLTLGWCMVPLLRGNMSTAGGADSAQGPAVDFWRGLASKKRAEGSGQGNMAEPIKGLD
jgi:hypothetical protein